jgi:hypothetical protein
MVGGTVFFVGLAAFFFFVYGRRKSMQRVPVNTVPLPVSEMHQ